MSIYANWIFSLIFTKKQTKKTYEINRLNLFWQSEANLFQSYFWIVCFGGYFQYILKRKKKYEPKHFLLGIFFI